MEQAVEKRQPALNEIKVHPALESLRSDPRYTALLKKMNLPLD